MTVSKERDTPMRCGPKTRPALLVDAKSAQRRRRSQTSPIGRIQTIGAADSQHAPFQSPAKSLRNLESHDWKYSLTKITRHQGVSQSITVLFNRVTETVEPVTIGKLHLNKGKPRSSIRRGRSFHALQKYVWS